MSSGARRARAAVLIVITTALLGAAAFATGLVMRLDGGGAPVVSTAMLAIVIVHGVLGLWLLWAVARADALAVRARYSWWLGSGTAVVVCLVLAVLNGLDPSGSAMLDVGLGVLGAILTGREVRAIGTSGASGRV